HTFFVPDFGVCSPRLSFSDPDEVVGISCRSPLHEPRLTQIQMVEQNASSSCKPAAMGPDIPYFLWQGSLDTAPAQFSIASVKFPYAVFPGIGTDPTSGGLHLCPGTPITFTWYQSLQRA